jgi:hypothetical protein
MDREEKKQKALARRNLKYVVIKGVLLSIFEA